MFLPSALHGNPISDSVSVKPRETDTRTQTQTHTKSVKIDYGITHIVIMNNCASATIHHPFGAK